MTNKEKLRVTENSIVSTRNELRGVIRKLDIIKTHKSNKDLISKAEILRLEELEELLQEIEYRINNRLFDME